MVPKLPLDTLLAASELFLGGEEGDEGEASLQQNMLKTDSFMGEEVSLPMSVPDINGLTP